MSSTPRKSSIASRRAPSSLRAPSAGRKASNPHLSLIFAQGGSVPHHAAGESSKSEAALSRQLDGDLGGQRMGLRSRRSSSATVHTMRTTSAVSIAEEGGVRSPVLPEEEEEDEGEGGMPRAGPSRTPMRTTRTVGPRGEEEGEGQVIMSSTPGGSRSGTWVDPRTSNAWRRWNPPPPTFPKTSIGKGKGKEVVANGAESMRSVATERGRPPAPAPAPSSERSEGALAKSVPPAEPPDTEGTATIKLPEAAGGSLVPPSPGGNPPPGALGLSTPKRSWWSRSPIPWSTPKPPTLGGLPPPTLPVEPPAPPLRDSAVDVPPSSLPPVADPVAAPAPDPGWPTAPPPTSPHPPEDADTTLATQEPQAGNGWFSYLTWGRAMASTSTPGPSPAVPLPPTSQPSAQTSVPTSGELASSPTARNARPAPVDPPPVILGEQPPHAISPPTAPSTLPPAPPAAPVPPQQPGWSAYLYSFVSSAPATPLPASSPTQPPVLPPGSEPHKQPFAAGSPSVPPSPGPSAPAAHPVVEVAPTASSPSIADTPTLGESPSLRNVNVPPNTLRTSSVASANGWLHYLAFRASQKKITGSTVASNGSASGRPSGEEGREEVMDLSGDPDFPAGPGGSPAPPAGGVMLPPPVPLPKDGKIGKAESTKASALEISGRGQRGQRLSISSDRSSKTPLSSSPIQPTKLEVAPPPSGRPGSTKSAKGSVKGATGSSLPPAPAAPTAQPNLVIPTFETTFDRPPRSLPPLPPAPTSGSSGTTGGLAWKALAAAGTYVYRSDPKPSTPSPAGTPTETRGMKEGRSVGPDLPRRIGLDGGVGDEGWKGVKRVVVVGVHGWFPAKMLNSVIGEPTGTSTKFAAMMGAAVTKFFEDRGPLPQDFRLTLMPLEGEGTIDNRVDKLYKAYLSNPAWINELRRADAIFFAAHSQGCIVTAHLLWRMITQGHIRTPLNREAVARCEWAFGPIGLLPPEEPRRGRRARPAEDWGKDQKVAMLAMCGVHLGPLYSISTSTVIQPYLQWFENAAARELFEFQESTSAVSVAYQKALSMILDNDVRVVLLASLNDQVVPIYGASFCTATHPLLLRALFVDGASYSASDFITQLLCFAFMLRNAGIDDQRLVEHLSEATAGSLTGLGHSSPYEEPASYDLVVHYLFRTGPARKPHAPLSIEPFSARDARNDFELPWIMRALVDSPEVKDLFPEELRELKEGVSAWKPNTKALKEIKRRLEPMAGRQSKLRPMTSNPSSTSLNSMSKTPSKDGKGGGGLGKDW